MLTLKQLRDDKQAAIRKLAKKHVDAEPVINRIEELDDERKAVQAELDACLAQQNTAAKQIGALMGKGLRDEAEAKKGRSSGAERAFQRVVGTLQAGRRAVAGGDRHAAQLSGGYRPRGRRRRRQPRREARRELHSAARRPAAPLGAGQEIRHNRFRSRRQAHRCRISRIQRQGRPSATCVDKLLPRLQHGGRISRSGAASAGKRGVGLRHGTAARQGGSDVPRHGRQLLSRAHGRSACHEHIPRRDSRREGFPRQDDRLYPCFRREGPDHTARMYADSTVCTSSTRWRSCSCRCPKCLIRRWTAWWRMSRRS